MPPENAPATPAPIQPPTTNKPIDAALAQNEPKRAEVEVKKVRVSAHERAIQVKAKLKAEEEKAEAREAKEADDDAEEKPKPKAAEAKSKKEDEPKQKLEAKPKTEAKKTEEDEPDEDEPKAKAETKKPEPAPDADAERRKKAAEDRLARLAAARDKERKEEAERASKRRSETNNEELERLRKRVAELEPTESYFKSEEALLAEAERRGMTVDKMAAWMRQRLTDPNAHAQAQARTVEERIMQELAKERAERQRLEQRIAEREQKAAEERAALQRAQEFQSMVDRAADTHPRTAALVRRKGMAAVVQFANEQVVPYLPEGYELQHLHDVMETYLDWLYDGDSPAQQNGHEPPAKKSGAAKPVTTLSDDVVSAREGVTEQIPLHRLSKAERIARVKRNAERE